MIMSRPPSPPNGWTFDPEELDYEEEWAADDSIGQEFTAAHHLGKGYPVMCSLEGDLLMFKAGENFYFWGREDDKLFDIVSTDLDEIISIMKEGGLRALRWKHRKHRKHLK